MVRLTRSHSPLSLCFSLSLCSRSRSVPALALFLALLIQVYSSFPRIRDFHLNVFKQCSR